MQIRSKGRFTESLTDEQVNAIFQANHGAEESEYYAVRPTIGTTLERSIDILVGRGACGRVKPHARAL
jgi:hypothetical protein